MSHIAIIGAGFIGRAWSIVFARAGIPVRLWDPDKAAAATSKNFIAARLPELHQAGLLDRAPDAILARITIAPTMEAATEAAIHVQENGPERLDIKQKTFARLDTILPPDIPIASSTSGIPASAFTENLANRHRCLVAHPVNPPHLVPIVELAPAPWTDPKVVAKARRLYEKAGQVPIVLRKEKAGFVLNRLQAVLLAEAFRIVGEGVASAEDVDKTIRDGLGLRWSFMGPFETIELNAPGGIPDYCARYSASLDRMVKSSEGLGNPFEAATVETVMSEWRGAQSPERVKRLSDWRDTRLAALQAHKRASQSKPE